jgi:hypothetical protein
MTISTEPQRVQREGRWLDIDTELVEGSDGMLAPAASPTAVKFSAGGSGPMARVQTTSGAWMTLGSPLGALPDGIVDDSSVTYPEVLPGVDLRLTATKAGMSEILVVRTPEAAENPRLAELRFGVTGAKVADGAASESATATAADGSQLVSASPMWWDSSDGGDADGPGGAGLAEPVPTESTASSITVDASVPADAADVTYPAYVDPDFTGGTQAWTFVDSRYPNSSYWLGSNHGSDNEAHVGYISAAYSSDGAHTDRTFWQLNTSGLYGKHILGATFNTQEIYSSACTNNLFNLYITGGIGSGTTWNTQPGAIQLVSQATLGPQRSNCPNQYGVGFDAMGVANWAAQNGNAAMTVMMNAANEGDYTTWRRFTHDATLTVRYNSAPYNPWEPWNAGSPCTTTSPGPTFRNSDVSRFPIAVTSSDPDAGANVGVVFFVQTPAGANVLDGSYPSGWIDAGMHAPGAFQVNIPTSLPDGAYRWTSRTYDGTDWSPGYSPVCYFQIRNAPPSAPVVTPSVPTTDTLTVGAPVTVTLGQAAAADNVVGFAYTWQPSVNAPTYSSLPACGNDSQAGGIHYVCGSSATIQVAPEEAPQAKLTVWAFGSASARSAPTTLTWSTVAADPNTLYASAHQWTTDLGGPVPAAQCLSGSATVSCLADNNVPDLDQPSGQWPIAIPSGVTLGDSSAPAPVTFIAGAAAENQGLNTVTLTVPAGVTTSQFGVVTVATAENGMTPGATLPGWTVRDDQALPAGESTSSSYIFTRLGGQKAGDVLTVTMPENSGATMAAVWYDTGGRDVQAVGPIWDTNAKNLPTVTWPAASYTGTADVLLVAASRTAGGPTIGAPAGAAIDYQQFITTTWNGGGIFGHAEDVPPTTYAATWNGGVVSHNLNALQLVLANPAPIATGGPVGTLTFGPASTTPMISEPGVVVDTTKSFTVGGWLTPTAATGLYQTAVSERGQTNSGFSLQLDPQMRWTFAMVPTNQSGGVRATAASTAAIGQSVYVAGVWDAVNHEVRLYLNGSLAATQGYWPPANPTADQGLTVGSGWSNGAVVDRWNGQIANPVVAQAALTSTQIFQLQTGGFFPSLD